MIMPEVFALEEARDAYILLGVALHNQFCRVNIPDVMAKSKVSGI